VERISKDELIRNGWKILSDSKFKKKKETKNLLLTVPGNKGNNKKNKQTEVKSTLQKNTKIKKQTLQSQRKRKWLGS
jgi:hypothetical protein